eukprot:TRINITY_DN2224_c0_g1_i3.p1 TRINITY_DN2224_c0_g1~~TRINITY_DN2224_c0_g1_i3.p1  ORF type:complete len:376 (-),score=64.69 TRINITY_DN2224_c0_g1_i3:83-1210(-)
MEESTSTMSTVLNDVLSFQRLEEGKLDMDMTPFNIHDLLRRSMLSVEASLRARDISLTLKHDHDIPQLLLGDKTRLKQVIQNLLSNSIKFSSEGSIITVESKRISEDYDDKKSANVVTVEVSIRDQGIGISPSDQVKLFQPYVQIRPGDLQDGRGSGLGLSICKQIIEAHQGEIAVHSELGNGSVFSFRIPFHCSGETSPSRGSSSDASIPPSSPTSSGSSYNSSADDGSSSISAVSSPKGNLANFSTFDGDESPPSPHILVVDDVRSNRRMMEVALEKLNFKVDTAADGLEAWEKCKNGIDYHLILLDNVMPRMTGLEFSRKIRSIGSRVPIIGITGNALDEDISEFLQAGASRVLTKPVQIAQLLEAVESLLP